MTEIPVSNAQNCGIHQSGFTVLYFRNDGPESPGILNICSSHNKEPLTKVLTYATNQKKYLETFVEDGWLPISNNLCGANIKSFATARRSGLFVDIPKGATANAVLYTLVESTRANGLDVYSYLKYLLAKMPNNQHLENPEILERYLPWSQDMPEDCRLKRQNKKCLKL